MFCLICPMRATLFIYSYRTSRKSDERFLLSCVCVKIMVKKCKKKTGKERSTLYEIMVNQIKLLLSNNMVAHR